MTSFVIGGSTTCTGCSFRFTPLRSNICAFNVTTSLGTVASNTLMVSSVRFVRIRNGGISSLTVRSVSRGSMALS